MYSTCVFCYASLGRNDAVENFPVGRRLAFDSEKGRLWAVCTKCGRWNLTPVEERWEAIEECERLFRGTIIRASTDQVGLAKIREGTDLIRIGKPLRPEFAAWRYTRHFVRRRRLEYASILLPLLIGIPAGLFTGTGSLFVSLTPLLYNGFTRTRDTQSARKVIVDHASRGFGRKVRKHEGVDVRMIPSPHDQGWGLRFALDGKFLDHHGWQALHMAHLVAPAINFAGASADTVSAAVTDIDAVGSPEKYFRKVLRFGEERGWHHTGIYAYPPTLKIAFEMLVHEETERAAIDGELAQLEADWKEAEEIAAIADDLLLPPVVSQLIDKFRGKA
ncbi:MAG TPA: hypothetical protein VJL35_13130 [Gemmatimonadaceae bacterium]|nr:hypothetical protein [Gemmatimonadaceae bacterium]